MDDHSRFIVGYGLHATQSAALVLELLRAAVTNDRPPLEILTDNGSQYVTWRGKSAFSKECEKRGIKQIVAKPRRPQTLGKIERFWGTLWRECVESAIFRDLDDARKRVGHFIDYDNFQRTHSGIGGLVPADRYFEAAPEVLKALRDRVDKDALGRARNGPPRKPFYLTGNTGGEAFSLHAEGERIFLTKADGLREEVELESGESAKLADGPRSEELSEPLASEGSPIDTAPSEDCDVAPGRSALDAALRELDETLLEGVEDESGGEESAAEEDSVEKGAE